jgi:hypothetical protein
MIDERKLEERLVALKAKRHPREVERKPVT